jgi:acyl-CoA reductase-like NAD-dependent aldehyde dehydrogenase
MKIELFYRIFAESVLCGPVHNEKAVELYETTLEDVNASGGKLAVGGKVGNIFKLKYFG